MTKFPFKATITANGKSYEVEVHKVGMKFIRWLDKEPDDEMPTDPDPDLVKVQEDIP